jgi:hypothetical protein
VAPKKLTSVHKIRRRCLMAGHRGLQLASGRGPGRVREIRFVSQERRGQLSALRLGRLPKADAWSTTIFVEGTQRSTRFVSQKKPPPLSASALASAPPSMRPRPKKSNCRPPIYPRNTGPMLTNPRCGPKSPGRVLPIADGDARQKAASDARRGHPGRRR